MKKLCVGAVGCAALIACGPPPVTDMCKGRSVGDVVITEIMIDPAGVDTGAEWFEIYNTLGTDLDLKGMVLTFRDVSGGGAKSHVVKAGIAKAQSYFTFGDTRAGALPTWIGYSYSDGLGDFSNGSGIVGIKCGATIFDEFKWTRAARANRSRMLDPMEMKTSTNNDDETKWCDTQPGTVYVGSSAGTPGAENVACLPEAMVGTCVEAGVTRPINPPGAGDLIITEIMANPKVATSTTGEWFEVLATRAVDLNDMTIATPTGDTDINNNACIPVSPGEYILFARSADPFINGSLPTPKLTYSLTLTDTMSRLFLRRGDAGIDEAAYNTAGAAGNGVSWQLDDNQLNATANDNPLNFCLSTMQWDAGAGADAGTDYGSPGARNQPCMGIMPDGGTDAGNPVDAGDPNQCFDVGTMAMRPIVKAMAGDFVITEFMADPVAAADNVGEWFEVLSKGTADLNGVQLTGNSGNFTFSSGDCLRHPDGTLLLFANNPNASINGGIGPLTDSFAFGLTNTTTGRIRVFTDAGIVDEVTWATSPPGRSRQLDINKQDAVQNDIATNFCDGDGGIVLVDGGVGDRGSPGTPNHACP